MDVCILFDVDGTLIDTGRAGIRAMAAAFLERFGTENAQDFSEPGPAAASILRCCDE